MAEVIRVLQTNAVSPFILQLRNLQRRPGVARGETTEKLTREQFWQISEGVEMTWEKERLVITISKQAYSAQPTVLLDRKDKAPIVCEAQWDEPHKQWTAEIVIDNPEEVFEVYLI